MEHTRVNKALIRGYLLHDGDVVAPCGVRQVNALALAVPTRLSVGCWCVVSV